MCYKEPILVWCTLHNGIIFEAETRYYYYFEHNPPCIHEEMHDTNATKWEEVECDECKRKQERSKKDKETRDGEMEEEQRKDGGSQRCVLPSNLPKIKAR
jgi:hypothetical protein